MRCVVVVGEVGDERRKRRQKSKKHKEPCACERQANEIRGSSKESRSKQMRNQLLAHSPRALPSLLSNTCPVCCVLLPPCPMYRSCLTLPPVFPGITGRDNATTTRSLSSARGVSPANTNVNYSEAVNYSDRARDLLDPETRTHSLKCKGHSTRALVLALPAFPLVCLSIRQTRVCDAMTSLSLASRANTTVPCHHHRHRRHRHRNPVHAFMPPLPLHLSLSFWTRLPLSRVCTTEISLTDIDKKALISRKCVPSQRA